MRSTQQSAGGWLIGYGDRAAVVLTALAFLTRLWAAHGIFLNPDEALHFRLANQASWRLAYQASLTASHPPLLTFVLYGWRWLGTSDLWLRMPSVLSGTAFCGFFYHWLSRAAGRLAGLLGLLFAAFLPPVVLLGVELRQYGLLIAFLAAALYFLDAAFTTHSALRMAAFSLCLYLAMLSHYSAFLFAAALGMYSLYWFYVERRKAKLVWTWMTGQLFAFALALFLYKTHLSKLGQGESRTPLQGWMSEFFLSHSYFDRAHDHAIVFLIGHTFGVFQYFFGQLAVGDVMGLIFLIAIVILLRDKNSPASRRLAVLFVSSFAVAGGVSLLHVYPYGGTRHVAFLLIPALGAVSVALARWSRQSVARGITIAALVLIACLVFGKARRPWIDRAAQSSANMTAAMNFIRHNVAPSQPILTDYQSDLILGHYLCRQAPITLDESLPGFERFSCDGFRVVSANYKTATAFTAEGFAAVWNDEIWKPSAADAVNNIWVFQAGWDTDLGERLKERDSRMGAIPIESFGNSIRIFQLPAGQVISPGAPTPAAH